MIRRHFLTGAFSSLAFHTQAREAPIPQRREFVAPHMGTLWRLVFYLDDDTRARAARDAAWSRLAELNARLSDYSDDSELSHLSRDGRIDAPSSDLRRILIESRRIAELTGGAFDITVGPVVRLWREARKTKKLPASAEIQAARALVDWRAVEVSEHTVRFRTRGGRLDLGGIGKGFAQDEVLRLLREEHGLDAVLIDAGGGVSVGSPPPGQPGWIASLDATQVEAPVSLSLHHQSLATSGDAHQFVEIDGIRYSHIVDPATGLGLTTRRQASVLAREGATADALATAFCILTEENSRAFLKTHPAAEARLVSVSPDSRPRVWESRGFARSTIGG